MKRYIKIYLSFIRINFSLLLTYRTNFFTDILTSVGWGAIGIFNIYLLTSRISGAYGWSRNELIVLAGLYPIFSGIFYLLCARNIGKITDTLHRGELDLLLIKPIDSQFFLSFCLIDFVQIVRIVVCIVFLFIFAQSVHLAVSLLSILTSCLLLVSGLVLLYSIWFGVITISVWFTNLSNLKDLLYISNGISRYPTSMFTKQKNFLFSIFLIFTLSLTVPTRALFQKSEIGELILLLVLSLVALFTTRKFWKFALVSYTSASS